jgi:hypothetical protein
VTATKLRPPRDEEYQPRAHFFRRDYGADLAPQ